MIVPGPVFTEDGVKDWQPPPPMDAVCDGICFTPLPSVGSNPRVAIHTVRYQGEDWVRIRNVTEEPVSFDGWFFSTGETTVAIPAGITVPSLDTFTFHLASEGVADATNVYLADAGLALEAAGEVALFSGEDLTDTANIRAYVRWGTDPSGPSHMQVADQAELWHRAGHFAICEGEEYVGFIAVGNITIPRGWRNQTAACFERFANLPK